jgi:hypothetical protein
MKPLRQLRRLLARVIYADSARRQMDELKILTGQILANQIRARGLLSNLRDAEFRVFSQFGDDGIIQYLIHQAVLKDEQRTFVEFGVENYREANTRFLLVNNNWRGLVMDSNDRHIAGVRSQNIYWKYDLTAVPAFVDKDNINRLLSENSVTGEIGLLSIDIDGNDYWVWESIEVITPVIVIVEYNSLFGNRYPVTVPYDPRFRRLDAHYSGLYWGCSLPALAFLAKRKGYAFVGCNSVGNNAYFVREDRLGKISPLSGEAGYTKSSFRDSRDRAGRLSFIGGNDRRKLIHHLMVYDVAQERQLQVADL